MIYRYPKNIRLAIAVSQRDDAHIRYIDALSAPDSAEIQADRMTYKLATIMWGHNIVGIEKDESPEEVFMRVMEAIEKRKPKGGDYTPEALAYRVFVRGLEASYGH